MAEQPVARHVVQDRRQQVVIDRCPGFGKVHGESDDEDAPSSGIEHTRATFVIGLA